MSAGAPNMLDRAIAAFAPAWGFRRQQYRGLLAFYEATKSTRLRRARTKDGTGDAVVSGSATKLRAYARDLERNYDVARGALSRLVQNTVGPSGIAIEPQPRDRNGQILEDFVREILALWRDWAKRPEVTWQHDWPSAQRMLARAWFRDGEAFAQALLGTVPGLDHGTRVPLSLELFESDSLPLDYTDESRGIVQGVERNSWGRPLAYWLYKTDPAKTYRLTTLADLKRIEAGRMLHIKLADRMLQARGVSAFASVLARLDDVKDYEDSERIAAKVAASMAAYIKKGMPDQYQQAVDADGNTTPRNMKFRPGVIFDDLLPGEEIGTIDSKRPNPVVEDFRKGQLRAAAGGLDMSYSSLARDYNGTFSAQRQELVEQDGAYAMLAAEFGARIVQPVYERFLSAALASGLLALPRELDPATLDDCILIRPQMPWIDPESEASADILLESAGYKSALEIIRRRGQNPRDVLEQMRNWQQLVEQYGVKLERGNAATAARTQQTARRQTQRAAQAELFT